MAEVGKVLRQFSGCRHGCPDGAGRCVVGAVPCWGMGGLSFRMVAKLVLGLLAFLSTHLELEQGPPVVAVPPCCILHVQHIPSSGVNNNSLTVLAICCA